MVSLSASLSSSRAASMKSSSQHSLSHVPTSPSSSSSASSSKISLGFEDDENITITSHRLLDKRKGKQKSHEDLRILAVSTHITELSYSISDIQTRIFEIQELRHKSHSSGDAASTTSVIDQSLMSLDERLESVAKGMKIVNDSLEPLLRSAQTPTRSDSNEDALILRKHATLVAEWEAVQDESDVLREELKEDKWLTVFRTVTEQADGMMSSLEKAVNRCQDFIWQVHRRGPDESISTSSSTTSSRNDKTPLNLDVFTSLLDSFEAKKKHYMPATSKVLSIIDKGVQDRVTKNGETLRRHAESAQRWRNLRERISRTDAEMGSVRKILLSGETTPSEGGSSTSAATRSTKNGYLATPPTGSKSRAPSAASTLSRSISPFRRFAKKFTGGTRSPAPATPVPPKPSPSRTPSSEPIQTLRRQRTSIFAFRGNEPPTPITPDRPGHKYSQSLTPESSPSSKRLDPNSTVKSRTPAKQRWNSSTKVEPEDRGSTVKATPPKRPSASGIYGRPEDIPPVPPIGTPYRRSLSRSSMASSRPWSPVTSSISTAPTSNPPIPISITRPSSRAARPPSRAQTPGLSATPRPRPKTPSYIPAPAKVPWSQQSDGSWDNEENSTTLMQRAFSPTFSASGASAASLHVRSSTAIPPRPPSRSMIPVPSLNLQSASRPSSAMSQYRSESPAQSSFRGSATRAQTPESALRAMAQQIPFYQGTGRTTTPRPSLQKLPPSSFKDAGAARTPVSRPGSRTGAYTPSLDQNPVHQYVPVNSRDPLDAEVANIVNSIAHGLLIERVDPPLKTIPKEGEEIRAQYAFSNSLSRKVVTCRLTTLTRSTPRTGSSDTTTKKVMCRVGGGWQDLQLYMLNRQAGM